VEILDFGNSQSDPELIQSIFTDKGFNLKVQGIKGQIQKE
jgi:hypothetical protein